MICRTLKNVFHGNDERYLEETCSRVLAICKSHSLRDGIFAHSLVIKLGLNQNLYLNNNILSLYARCNVEQASQLFEEMPHRDVASWTALIAGQGRCRNHEKAMELFGSMIDSAVKPNQFTLSTVLRSCSALGKINAATCIHAIVLKQGFQSNLAVRSTLVDLYSKGGNTEESLKLFEEIDNGDTISWTSMISVLIEDGNWNQALEMYLRMIKVGVHPNAFTFVKLLSASSSVGLNIGTMLHGQLIRWEIEMDVILKTALVNMYARNRSIQKAIQILRLTPECDLSLWTTVISSFVQLKKIKEAFCAFNDMEMSGVAANNFTYSSLLSACCSIMSLKLGQQLHSRIIVVGLETDVSIGNALIDMYMKCSDWTNNALDVFRNIDSPNVVSWTSMISGLAEHGFLVECFRGFTDMRISGVEPNSFTLSSIVKACGSNPSSSPTKQLHGYIIKTKCNDILNVGNALVDSYASSNQFDDARLVIQEMNCRDAITYTGLATKLNRAGYYKTVLDLINVMSTDGVKMDEFSLACFFSAATSLTSIKLGQQLHCYSIRSGLGNWISVLNGLVQLYGKCKIIPDAIKAFEDIPQPDIVSWNTLILQLASNQLFSTALSAYEDMRITGIKPDGITLLFVLVACGRGGLVDRALEYFQSIPEAHGIELQLNHYSCLIELLGQAGRLEEARDIIGTMSIRSDASIYKKLLNGCVIHKNVYLGEEMARKGLELNPFDPSFYKLLIDLYDSSRNYELGDKAREAMRNLRKWHTSSSSDQHLDGDEVGHFWKLS